MTTLQISGGFDIAIDPAASAWRDKLLAGAAFVTVVDSQPDQEIAVAIMRDLKEHLKGVELARKSVKEPILSAGKRVDSMANDHSAPLQAQFDRVSSLVAGFQAKERARVAIEEQNRQAEVFRLENERREAALLANKAAAGIQTEQDLAKAIAAEEAAKEATAAADLVIRAPLPATIREPGMIVRKKLDFEVTDINVLYKARPELCRIEVNRSAVLSLCTINSVVPGLKFTETLVTSVRA